MALFVLVAALAESQGVDWNTLVVALAGVAGGAIPVYLTQRNKPSRRVADTAAIVDVHGKVITTLEKELSRINAELEASREEARALRAEIEERPTKAELQRHVNRLQDQLRRLGETPVNGVPGR